MRETGIVSIDLLKVDIEGAEIEVFESCPWIKNVQITAIELHERVRPGCSATVTKAAGDFHWDQRGEITFVPGSHSMRVGASELIFLRVDLRPSRFPPLKSLNIGLHKILLCHQIRKHEYLRDGRQWISQAKHRLSAGIP